MNLTFNLAILFFQERIPLFQTAFKASWLTLRSTLPSGDTEKEKATALWASAMSQDEQLDLKIQTTSPCYLAGY